MKGFIDQIKLFQTYKAFYGRNPNFDNENEEMNFQLAACLLNEYDVFEGSFVDWNYYGNYVSNAPISKEFIYTPFSYEVHTAYDELKCQSKNLTEEEMGQIYRGYCSFVDEIGIRAISCIVSNHIKNINVNPTDYLKKLSNVLQFRLKSLYFLNEQDEKPKTIIAKELVTAQPELGYSVEEVEEIMNFIYFELGLSNSSVCHVSPMQSIQKAEENGINMKTFDASIYLDDSSQKRLIK